MLLNLFRTKFVIGSSRLPYQAKMPSTVVEVLRICNRLLQHLGYNLWPSAVHAVSRFRLALYST